MRPNTKAYQESLARLQAKVRAYQQTAANVVTAYEAMSYEQRMAACNLVEAREGRRTFRISELVAANEELQTRAMGAQVICKVQEAA